MNTANRTPQLGPLAMLMVGFSLLMGCSLSEEATGPGKTVGGIAVPQQITAQMKNMPEGEMAAYASLDGGVRQKMTVSEGNFRVSHRFDNLPPGLHALSVVFEFTRANETQAIDIAKGVYTVNLKPGKNNPGFTEDSYEYANSDADQLTNLQELILGSNPLVDDLTTSVDAAPMSKEVTLSWTQNQYVTGFNIYVSADENCDVKNYTTCTEGAMFSDKNSPYEVTGLSNGTPYYFQLESVYKLGATEATTVEPPVGARPNTLVVDVGGVNENRAVSAIATDNAGNIYIGGSFKHIGPATGGGVPIDKITGRASNAAFPIVVGTVFASAPDGKGGWYIGGSFTGVNGLMRNNLAHIHSDGQVDPDWNPNANDVVETLAVDSTTVYVGGRFTTIGGQVRNRLAAITMKNGSVLNWNPNANDGVQTLVVDGNNDTVYVGGSFTAIGGNTRKRLAAIATDGSLRDWNPGADNGVRALAIDRGRVYVGGWFTTIGDEGYERNRLAAINTDGTLLDWNPNANGVVLALAVDGNRLYIGGNFTKIGEQKRNYIAAIENDGTLHDWDPKVHSIIHTIAVDETTVYVGGYFEIIKNQKRNRLAAINTDGTLLDWNPGANGTVLTLVVEGNTVYVGGGFTSIGGQSRKRLAAIDPDGILLDWNPTAIKEVSTLAVDGDTVYVGGEFDEIEGQVRNHLAAIGTDRYGTLRDWNPNVNGSVSALVVDSEAVYVGGEFTTVGDQGEVRNRLAAFDRDSKLLSWNPNADGNVRALAVDGSVVYVGGEFTTVTVGENTDERIRLAAIARDGTLLSWNPKVSDKVLALAIDGSTVYVGGDFTTVDDGDNVEERIRLAAISTVGNLLDWNPSADGEVLALAVDGNRVYMGGEFTTITIGSDGEAAHRNRLAAISTDGALLDWSPGATKFVSALAVEGNTVHVGGRFNAAGGYVRGGLARIATDGVVLH